MDKKRALICSIILYVIGIVALIAYLIGSVILKTFPANLNTYLPIWFVMFFIGGAIMTVVYVRQKREAAQAANRAYQKRKRKNGKKSSKNGLPISNRILKTQNYLT